MPDEYEYTLESIPREWIRQWEEHNDIFGVIDRMLEDWDLGVNFNKKESE